MPIPKHRRRAEYFEATIQLRPAKHKLYEYVLDAIENSKDCTIAKIEEDKNGMDIQVSSQRFARALGKKLTRRFDGELKLSRKLFTRDMYTSKEIYRVTVLFRMNEEKEQ